ncbi:MAG: PAS domain-containing protein [Alphaproteobacteria bacterium]|nr:PAS domain-containing protein [Alphaproteobacteria bacterium]
MKHRNSHLLVGYWSRLRHLHDVPDQTDIDPRDIKRLLPYVFILDAEDPARPIYRLAGTALCERFGFELKGTGFLAHWEARSATALVSLLEQSLKMRQPVCLTSIGASVDCGMVELETVLAPIKFGSRGPTRFVGMIQVLSDANLLCGRPVAFQRLAASQLIREGDPRPVYHNSEPPPPPPPMLRGHPKAPHLRLIVSRDKPAVMTFAAEDILTRMFNTFGSQLGAG